MFDLSDVLQEVAGVKKWVVTVSVSRVVQEGGETGWCEGGRV